MKKVLPRNSNLMLNNINGSCPFRFTFASRENKNYVEWLVNSIFKLVQEEEGEPLSASVKGMGNVFALIIFLAILSN